MAAQGYKGWHAWQCRDTFRDLKHSSQAVDGGLLVD
jgi:hypothetical protein